MYIVPRKQVNILASNLTDADTNYTQFTIGTSYASGVEVQYGQDIFVSVKDSNTVTPIAETTTLNWKYLKKANKWAAFDPFNATKTKHATQIMYVIESRYVDYIGMLNLKATNVKLELFNLDDNVSTATPLWSYEEKTFYRKCYNYTEYITKDGTFKRTFLKDIFPYFKTKLKITITGTNVEVGNIIFNKKIDLGMVLANNNLVLESGNLIDIEIDSETGNIKQVPIMPKKDLTIPVIIDTKDFERVQNVLEDYLGEACLFIALRGVDNKLPNLALYGFYKSIRIPVGLENCEYELLIKGVI